MLVGPEITATVRAASSEMFVHWYWEEPHKGSRYPHFCAPRLGAHVERVFSTVPKFVVL